MSDPAADAFMKQVAEASQQGKPLAEILAMAEAFLAAQPKEFSDSQRDELIEQVKMAQAQAPLLEKLMAAEDNNEAMGAMFQMMANLEAMQTPAQKKAQADRAEAFKASIAKAEQNWKKKLAQRRKKRVKLGLCEEAKTGRPGREAGLYPKQREKFRVKDVDEPLPKMLRRIEAAKLDRDYRELARLRPGESRLGGVPDLPLGVKWPVFKRKKIPFIAQIELAASGHDSDDTGLPADGWLYVFGLYDNVHHHSVIFLHRGPRKELVRAEWPADSAIRPDWCGKRVHELIPLASKPGKPKRGKKPDSADGWLFGEMSEVFGHPGRVVDEMFLDGEDWINLLAITSAGSMEWSDSGHLYLLIRRSDLKNLDFSKVVATIESS